MHTQSDPTQPNLSSSVTTRLNSPGENRVVRMHMDPSPTPTGLLNPSRLKSDRYVCAGVSPNLCPSCRGRHLRTVLITFLQFVLSSPGSRRVQFRLLQPHHLFRLLLNTASFSSPLLCVINYSFCFAINASSEYVSPYCSKTEVQSLFLLSKNSRRTIVQGEKKHFHAFQRHVVVRNIAASHDVAAAFDWLTNQTAFRTKHNMAHLFM